MSLQSKLTKGDQVLFQVWNGKPLILYFDKPFNEKQGFFKDEQQGGLYKKDYKNIIKINGKVINEITKMTKQQIIKEELENIINQNKQEVLTFENNPIEYILNRYPSLNETLISLLTTEFRDYITGIFVVAPKPTTFKIILHNGQFFFLTYTNQGYKAKVSGKQYFLMNLKEEEYATQAIANLLIMGLPPAAKGPGEEQSADSDLKSDFAADMTSEPDLGLDGIDSSPEVEPGEEQPEEEEPLQEEQQPKKITKFRIIKEIKVNEPKPLTLSKINQNILDKFKKNYPFNSKLDPSSEISNNLIIQIFKRPKTRNTKDKTLFLEYLEYLIFSQIYNPRYSEIQLKAIIKMIISHTGSWFSGIHSHSNSDLSSLPESDYNLIKDKIFNISGKIKKSFPSNLYIF